MMRRNEERAERAELNKEELRELIELGLDGLVKILETVEREIDDKERELHELRQEKCDLVIAMMRAQER